MVLASDNLSRLGQESLRSRDVCLTSYTNDSYFLTTNLLLLASYLVPIIPVFLIGFEIPNFTC